MALRKYRVSLSVSNPSNFVDDGDNVLDLGDPDDPKDPWKPEGTSDVYVELLDDSPISPRDVPCVPFPKPRNALYRRECTPARHPTQRGVIHNHSQRIA